MPFQKSTNLVNLLLKKLLGCKLNLKLTEEEGIQKRMFMIVLNRLKKNLQNKQHK